MPLQAKKPALIDDWKDVLKYSWVIRIGHFIGAAAGAIADYEGITIGLLDFLPPGVRLFGYMAAGVIVVSSLLISARLLKQENISGSKSKSTECGCNA